MRPIQLAMTAFGPYKQKEVIDFTELKDHSLFVIAGNTGAGKTTIFDAICFALYGSASGQDRDHHSMLRSHFADPHTHTAVELIFTIHDRTYRILRQLAHIRPGNKTPTGERYEFFEIVDAKEIPVVERQIVSEINQKVEEIIGLTENQFKQIVMLPQGEFLKLLTSETENKEAILRRLFKTDHYQQLNELLRQRKNKVDEKYREAKQACEQHISFIRATLPERENSDLFVTLGAEYFNDQQIIDDLAKERDYYLEKTVLDEKAYKKTQKMYDRAQRSLYEAKALNEKFSHLEAKEKLFQQLKQEKPKIKLLEQKLVAAKRAQRIKPYEEQYNQVKQTLITQKKHVEQLREALTLAEEQLKEAEQAFTKEQAKEPLRLKARQKLDRLKDFLPFVKELHERELKVARLRKQVSSLEQEVETLNDTVKDRQKEKRSVIESIRQLESHVNQFPTVQLQLVNVKEKLMLVDNYQSVNKRYLHHKEQVKIKQVTYKKAITLYKEREKVWFNNRAYHLALHLEAGEPCPVCGSHEHPELATATVEEMTRQEIQLSKEQADQAEREYNEELALFKTYDRQREEAKDKLIKQKIDIDKIESIHQQYLAKQQQLTKKIDELQEEQKRLEQRRKEEQTLDEQLTNLQKQLEEKHSAYLLQQTQLKEDEAVLSTEISRIPDGVRQLEKLEAKIEETKKKLTKLIDTFKEAEESFHSVQGQFTKLQTELTVAKTRLTEVKNEEKASQQKFHQALENEQFSSIEKYHLAILDEQVHVELEAKITDFQKTYHATSEQVKQLKEQLSGKEPVDLKVLEQQVVKLKQSTETALERWQRTKSLFKETDHLRASLEKATERALQFEKRLNVIADLYDVARGQNERRLSFERFLQIEYLEQIIDAANQRLQHLSKGQFWLRRSDRQESHGRQSGLAFDVFDEYTGKVRDVKTLSGGEKFNASLCLALGMSDVIQSFQGNISIETMFIDEGFGTLDEETLNKSIETLIDLQASGRMIGVISHVQALKTIFPAVLEVTKTRSGNSETKFIVN